VQERRLKNSSSSRAGQNSPDEQELVRLVRSKDPDGIRCFYDRYAGYLTAVCSRYLTGRADVEDTLQESFLQMIDHIGRFQYRGEGSLRAWASRIVVNQSLKALRKNGRLVYVEDLPEQEDEADFSLPEIPPGVILEMIRSLPDGYRTVFNLFVFEKKSHKEIAALLGIKEDTSASQFFRARATLAKKIKAYIKEQNHE
jgi:RNA polymerase sigma-70 factor (ECF subfamily)